MSTTTKERVVIHQRLSALGFSYEQANQLRRISMTLRNWFELECGTENKAGSSVSIERDEKTDKPIRRISYVDLNGKWVEYKYPVIDREKGALKRLSRLMEGFPDLAYYIQTDPRGCALYILRKSDVNGCNIEQVYSSCGTAVY